MEVEPRLLVILKYEAEVMCRAGGRLIIDMKADIIIDEFNRPSSKTKIQETEELNSRKQVDG